VIAYDGFVNQPPRDDPWNQPRHHGHDVGGYDRLAGVDPPPAPNPALPAQAPRDAPGGDDRAGTKAVEIIPRGASVRLFLAWSTIAICTVVIAVMQYFAMNSPELLATAASPGFNTIYLGRVSVGMHEAMGASDPSYLAALDEIARSSEYEATNQLRAAIVAGELQTRDDVMWRLSNTALPSDQAFDHRWGAGGWSAPTAEVDPTAVREDHALLSRIYGPEQYVPDAGETAQLVTRHGWFGELAASYNLAEADPARLSPRRSASIVAWSIVAMVGVAGLALFAGLVLLVLLIIFFANGTLTNRMPTGPPGHRTAYLETLAVFLIAFIAIQIPLGLIMLIFEVDLTLVMLAGLVLPIFWPLLFGVGFKRFKADMGWVAPKGVLREIGVGLGGYVAGLPIIAVGMGLTFLVGMISQQTADHPMGHEMVNGDLFTILTLVIAAVVWAPLVEESIFRAAFYRHLRRMPRWTGWALATVFSSFIFAAIHPQGYVGIPALMAIAFVLAGLREWRDSLIPSITAHALHNGALITMLLIVLYA